MIINGNYTVKGQISAGSMLFKELSTLDDMTRGVNILLTNGRVYYKIDDDNTFMIYSQEDIDIMISEVSGGGTSTADINLSDLVTNDIYNLLNVTLFSFHDMSNSQLLNTNFDTTKDFLKASMTIDKVSSLIYKNGYINKEEYWCQPFLYLTEYKNEDVIKLFNSNKFDNSVISAIDQTIVNDIYQNDLVEYPTDASLILDFLLDNTSDGVLFFDENSDLYNLFFTLNQLNYKMDIPTYKEFLSSILNKIFNKEQILYFLENYLTAYTDGTTTRSRVYFFDYRNLIQSNVFHIIDYIKEVQENPGDYHNSLSTTISTYKSEHALDDTFGKDYTSFEYDITTDEIIKSVFSVDSLFNGKIDWSALDVTMRVYEQNINSLNNPLYDELDLQNEQAFFYDGSGNISAISRRLNMSGGEFWFPIIEVDFPLDSYFFFTM